MARRRELCTVRGCQRVVSNTNASLCVVHLAPNKRKAQHGTAGEYLYFGCRCTKCREAGKANNERHRTECPVCGADTWHGRKCQKCSRAAREETKEEPIKITYVDLPSTNGVSDLLKNPPSFEERGKGLSLTEVIKQLTERST